MSTNESDVQDLLVQFVYWTKLKGGLDGAFSRLVEHYKPGRLPPKIRQAALAAWLESTQQ